MCGQSEMMSHWLVSLIPLFKQKIQSLYKINVKLPRQSAMKKTYRLGYAQFLIMSVCRSPYNVALIVCRDAQHFSLFALITLVRTFSSLVPFPAILLSQYWHYVTHNKINPVKSDLFHSSTAAFIWVQLFCKNEKLSVKPAKSCKLRPFF